MKRVMCVYLPGWPLQRLMWWAMGGFVATLVSGVLLVRANPQQYLGPPLNLTFYAKILCLVLIGLNDILYFATGLKREVDGVEAGEAASASAKLVANVRSNSSSSGVATRCLSCGSRPSMRRES